VKDNFVELWTNFIVFFFYLRQGGLMDRQECLTWILDLADRTRGWEDPAFDYVLPLILQFIREITLSELISRKLAYCISQRLSEMIIDNEVSPSSMLGDVPNVPASVPALAATLSELSSCPLHKRTFLSFCVILQVLLVHFSFIVIQIRATFFNCEYEDGK
jgi:hypothetical protein